MKPYFSIILPTYNQASFLEKCITSILNQTFQNWELIIIDNFSTDNTRKIIQKFRDKRFRFFKIKNKNILAKSRNLGIKKSNSKWICFIDSDDIWYPKKLELSKKFIEQYNGDLYYHDLEFINKYWFFHRKKIQDKSRTILKPIMSHFCKYGNGIGQSSVIVKKSILNKIGLISENKKKFSWEDFDTWIRISKLTQNFVRIPFILGGIYIGKENISTLEKQIENSINIKKNYKKDFYKFLDKKDNNKELWWLAYPAIISYFKNRDEKNFLKLISKITRPPFKIYFLIILMKFTLKFYLACKKMKLISNTVILYKNDIFKKKRIKSNNYKIISTYSQLREIELDNFKFPSIFYHRLRSRDNLHILYKKKKLLSYGWSTRKKLFFINEIETFIKNKNSIIFYDFKTLDNFQNKGFYKLLINLMLDNFQNKSCYIYSLLSNKKSNSGILDTGFRIYKKLSFFSEQNHLIEVD